MVLEQKGGQGGLKTALGGSGRVRLFFPEEKNGGNGPIFLPDAVHQPLPHVLGLGNKDLMG